MAANHSLCQLLAANTNTWKWSQNIKAVIKSYNRKASVHVQGSKNFLSPPSQLRNILYTGKWCSTYCMLLGTYSRRFFHIICWAVEPNARKLPGYRTEF